MALPDQVIYSTQDVGNMRHCNGNPNTVGVYGEPGWTCQDWTNGNLYVWSQTSGTYGWQLVSTYFNASKSPIVGGNRIVLLGDSITANNGGRGAAVLPTYNAIAGWFTWCNIRLKHRLQMIKNAGVAGDRTDQMLARFDSDVTPYSPSFVTVMGGTNDVSQSVAYQTIINNLTAIYNRCAAIGATCIALTIPPITTLSDSNRQTLQRVNRWIKEQSRQRSRFVVCDIGAAIVDTATSTFSTSWTPAAGLTADGVHPNAAGAILMGRLLADSLTPYFVSANMLITGSNDITNLLPNGGLVGVAPSGPNGFTASTGSGVWDYPARTDGIAGNWARIALTDYLQLSGPNITSGFAEGQKMYLTIEYEDLTYASGELTSFYLAIYRNGSNVAAEPATFVQPVNVPSTGVLETPVYTIPAGTTALRAYLFITFSGATAKSVKLGRFGMHLGDPLEVN